MAMLLCGVVELRRMSYKLRNTINRGGKVLPQLCNERLRPL